MSDKSLVFTKAPGATEVTLPGGAQVLVCESRAAPHVTLRIVVRGGSAHDEVDEAGLSSVTAGLMRSGAGDRDEPAFSSALDRLAARLGCSVSRSHWEVAGDVTTLRPRQLEHFLDLFADAAVRPRFEAAEVAKARDRRLASLKRLADDHSGMCARAFEMSAFEGHPHGIPATGTVTSVGAVNADRVRHRHAQAWSDRRAIFAIAGDISPDQALSMLSDRFGDWGPLAAAPSAPEGVAPEGLRATLVRCDDPGLSQVHFRIGAPLTLRLTSPDYFALRLASQILGGDFTARLNQRLRVQEGLTYGAHWSHAVSNHRCGVGAVSTYAPAKDAARAIGLALEELRRFVDEGPTEDEVRDFKRKLINAFPFRFETAGRTVDQHLWRVREGLPDDWLERYQAQVAALEADEIREAARRHIPARNAHIVAVGGENLAQGLVDLVGGEDRVTIRTSADFGLADGSAGQPQEMD